MDLNDLGECLDQPPDGTRARRRLPTTRPGWHTPNSDEPHPIGQCPHSRESSDHWSTPCSPITINGALSINWYRRREFPFGALKTSLTGRARTRRGDAVPDGEGPLLRVEVHRRRGADDELAPDRRGMRGAE